MTRAVVYLERPKNELSSINVPDADQSLVHRPEGLIIHYKPGSNAGRSRSFHPWHRILWIDYFKD